MSDKLINPCTIGRDAVHCRLMFPGTCAACGFSRDEQARGTDAERWHRLRRMELAGLEPATSWVRSRRSSS